MAGNYAGQLFLLYNRGSATEPHIHMPYDRNTLVTPTHTEGLLWCNYLAPFLYDWSGTGRLDLVMGDGSYSANSIYLFTNQGDNQRPVYNERQMTKLIAGLGREHLTPAVVDWNHDGKPDILAGERTGCVDLYLNHAASASSPPVFDEDHPQRVSFNGVDKIGALSTVCAADLNGDKLFDLLVGTPDGRILYSLNTGTGDAPKFGPLVPLKGVNPYPKIVKPMHWKSTAFSPMARLTRCSNAPTRRSKRASRRRRISTEPAR
ncbi:MAG: VCBS repeat-containing protein [Verrucomicrobiota bacterium]